MTTHSCRLPPVLWTFLACATALGPGVARACPWILAPLPRCVMCPPVETFTCPLPPEVCELEPDLPGAPVAEPGQPPALPPPGQATEPIPAAAAAQPPVPSVGIRVLVPATVPAGQEIEYRLIVENHSQAAAHHVLVRDPLPANARYVRAEPAPTGRGPELVWQLGTLEAGASREIVLRLAATGPGDVSNCARVQFEHGQCVTTRITRPALRLEKRGPTQAVLYDPLTFQLAVTNTGDADATGVILTDTLPAGLEPAAGQGALRWEVGTLTPGHTRTVEYHVVAKATGRLCNRAGATGAGGLRAQAESCVTVTEPKLSLTMAGPERRYLNQAVSYQLTVSNPGTSPAANVTVAATLPPRSAFVSASAGGRAAEGDVHWQLGTLEPGERRTLDLALRADAAGRLCTRATASADRGLTARAEACTDFEGVAALVVELADTDDPVAVGGETSYVIRVRNQGDVPATNVRLEARAPEQLAVTRATGPADNRKDGPVLTYQPLTLEAGGEARYEVFVKALRPGDVRFKVDVRADQLPAGPVHEEESTTVYRELPAAAEGATPQARAKRRP